MELNEILEGLRYNKGRFAREAVEAAIEKREEITPHLLRILEDTIERAEELDQEPEYMAHLYALHLLAQFRETRAYPLVARLFSIPGDVTDKLTSDFLTEGLGLVLASIAKGDPRLVKNLVENREAFVWARVGALRAIPAMVGAQELSREDALAYFQELLRGKLERQLAEKVSDLWDAVVSYAIDLYPEEIYEDIKKAYQKGLVNPGFVSLDDVDRWRSRGKEEMLQNLPKRHPLITDTIEEMHWWACFEEDRKEEDEERQRLAPHSAPVPSRPAAVGSRPVFPKSVAPLYPEGRHELRTVETIHRDAPKVGRNDPCPCGSGRKFKKCCAGKEVKAPVV